MLYLCKQNNLFLSSIMKRINIIAILLILVAFTSCKHDEVVCTLKGRILNDCNGAPFANQEIALKQELSSGLTIQGGILAETTTDADGNFVFTYQSENGESLSINYSGPIIEGIPLKKTQDLGAIIYSPSCKIVYRVKINNPYNIGDTLSCLNIENPSAPIRIAAPLRDTIIGTIEAYSREVLQYDTKEYSTIKGGWCIRSNSTIVFIGREVTIQVQNCNTVPDTLTMVID